MVLDLVCSIIAAVVKKGSTRVDDKNTQIILPT